MPDDIGLLVVGIAVLIVYLVWSAATEMGTKWPWQK
jgi:hypothetical protein